MGRHFMIVVAVVLLIGLGVGIFWTARLDVPKPTPWWYGKKTVFRAEVWEPGKDMATFSMTIPKQTLDFFYVFGLRSEIDLSHRHVSFDRFYKQIQRLPRGQKLRLQEDGATLSMWIQEPGETMPPDSATTAATLPSSGATGM